MARIWLVVDCAAFGTLHVYVDGDRSPALHEIEEFIEACTGYQGSLDTTSLTLEALNAQQEGARPLRLLWNPIMNGSLHPGHIHNVRRSTNDYVLNFEPSHTRRARPATRVSRAFPGPGHTIVDFDENRHDPSFRGNFYRLRENDQHTYHEGPSPQNIFSTQEHMMSSVAPFQGKSYCLGENNQDGQHARPHCERPPLQRIHSMILPHRDRAPSNLQFPVAENVYQEPSLVGSLSDGWMRARPAQNYTWFPEDDVPAFPEHTYPPPRIEPLD